MLLLVDHHLLAFSVDVDPRTDDDMEVCGVMRLPYSCILMFFSSSTLAVSEPTGANKPIWVEKSFNRKVVVVLWT